MLAVSRTDCRGSAFKIKLNDNYQRIIAHLTATLVNRPSARGEECARILDLA